VKKSEKQLMIEAIKRENRTLKGIQETLAKMLEQLEKEK